MHFDTHCQNHAILFLCNIITNTRLRWETFDIAWYNISPSLAHTSKPCNNLFPKHSIRSLSPFPIILHERGSYESGISLHRYLSRIIISNLLFLCIEPHTLCNHRIASTTPYIERHLKPERKVMMSTNYSN